MEEFLVRFWGDVADRLAGPMNHRFVLQPAVAVVLGIRDGLRYAREGRTFLLWAGPDDPAERRAQALATWRTIGKVFMLAIILDVACRWIAVNWVFPVETLIMAIGVAVVPYLGVRGLVRWLATPRPGTFSSDDRRL
jgi:hypothetical protein